jgi:hypothetical protein
MLADVTNSGCFGAVITLFVRYGTLLRRSAGTFFT